MSVALFDQDEIFAIAAAVKALNYDGSDLLRQALGLTRACADTKVKADLAGRKLTGDQVLEETSELLLRACAVANRVAYERMYGERSAEHLDEAGDADREWPEFLEPVPFAGDDPIHALRTRLKSLRYNLYTNAGRCWLGGPWEEALGALIDKLTDELGKRGIGLDDSASGWW